MERRRFTPEDFSRTERLGPDASAYKLDASTVMKTGDRVGLEEAQVMKLVREKTTIPVPEVFGAYVHATSHGATILMEFIEGDRLEDCWGRFTKQERQHVIDQLRDFMIQLRNLKGSFIGSVDGTNCHDQLLTDGVYGPYKDERSFNRGVASATLHSGWTGAMTGTILNMVLALNGHEIVLTHGDLCPRNILVQGTKVVAILDWAKAGYYPEYWEYVKNFYEIRIMDDRWNYTSSFHEKWINSRVVDKILKPYPMELAVILQIYSIPLWQRAY